MPATTSTLILTGIACFTAAAVLASFVVLRWLSRRQVLDRPNHRSSHKAPVPRGGGIGFMAVILVGLAIVYLTERSLPPLLLAAIALVVAVSFADDLRPRPFWLRLAAQAAAVAMVLLSLPMDQPILAAGLPVWLDRLLVGLAWLWFVNLFNFMDGIDGIASGEAATVAAGLLVLALTQTLFADGALPAVIIGAAAAAFLLLNWHPARLFMGDSGSTGLGFVLGWLLIEAAAAGFLAAALILPMFFVLDASTTLLARLVHRQPLATAHRDHAYQIAVDRGLGQRVVAGAVVGHGVVLIGLALLSIDAPIAATTGAVVLAVALIAWFRWGRPR